VIVRHRGGRRYGARGVNRTMELSPRIDTFLLLISALAWVALLWAWVDLIARAVRR